jgi:hypothetical protein
MERILMDINHIYNVSWDDYIDSQITYDRNSDDVAKNIKKTRFSLLSFYTFLILILYHAVEGILRILILSGILLLGASHIILVRKLFEMRVKKISKKLIKETNSDKIVGKKKLRIKENEIVYIEKEKNTKIMIKDIKKISESDKNYYIYVDETSAIILPKNNGGESETSKKIIEYIKDRMVENLDNNEK